MPNPPLAWIVLIALITTSRAAAEPKPAVADAYLDLTITYCIHAKSIWHDASAPDVGGYWGDGLAPMPEKNGNGNVRGMVNTMLGYAMLIHALDHGWLTEPMRGSLQQAGLSRDVLLNYIDQNLTFLLAHHTSAQTGLKPQWGMSWQSPLWLGAAGPAVLLVWKDLPDDLKANFAKICAIEADRIANKPPKDYQPGDTGAEENAWDEHAPAVALAVDPKNPHADAWMKALECYALNVYSLPSEKGKEGVLTANLFGDYTLENHGFFHPDYVQVSGQHLGEALLYLQMGDQINGTHLADSFKPFAMHNLAKVWQEVMLPLLQPDGQFAFPNGTDWTIHTSIEPAYLACISTLLHDADALDGEKRHVNNALRRRAVSPAGRIFGDTNMEWWWEPLLIKRCCTALLQHEYRDSFVAADASPRTLPTLACVAATYPDAKVCVYRNDNYFVSNAWGAKHMATFYPAFDRDQITLPIDGILPHDVSGYDGYRSLDDAQVIFSSVATAKPFTASVCRIQCCGSARCRFGRWGSKTTGSAAASGAWRARRLVKMWRCLETPH